MRDKNPQELEGEQGVYVKNTTLMKFSKKTLKKEYILMYTYQKKKKEKKRSGNVEGFRCET